LLLQVAVASQIIKQDGFGSLYKGLSAGLLRQVGVRLNKADECATSSSGFTMMM